MKITREDRLINIIDILIENVLDITRIVEKQQDKIEELEKKIDKLPDFAEWYIKNSGGGYQE